MAMSAHIWCQVAGPGYEPIFLLLAMLPYPGHAEFSSMMASQCWIGRGFSYLHHYTVLVGLVNLLASSIVDSGFGMMGAVMHGFGVAGRGVQ